MGISRIGLAAALFGTSCVIPLVALAPEVAHAVPPVDLTTPSESHSFGFQTLVLSNGNFVITDPGWDGGGGANRGAVFLYDGSAPAGSAPITTVYGQNDNDRIGSDGVYEVGTSNFVIASSNADVGLPEEGAVTWVSGSLAGGPIPVDASNSLHGNAQYDHVGVDGVVTLINGNYVVQSGDWTNSGGPGFVGLGAVTWQLGDHPGLTTAGGDIVGPLNSLVGATPGDGVGLPPASGPGESVVALTNGNFAIGTSGFNGGDGAVTWGNGTTGLPVGTVGGTNSVLGGAGDGLGDSLTALSNGNYVVNSPLWNSSAGAATFVDGSGPASPFTISNLNSIVGLPGDGVGFDTIALKSNGNYVVSSPLWDSARGAVTLGLGTGETHLEVDETNSLVGDSSGDTIGANFGFFAFQDELIVPLDDGNFVVGSPEWDSGRGAATLASGTTAITGSITAENSLLGAKVTEHLGSSVVATNGGYAVSAPGWSTATASAVGAVVFADGVSGVVGSITSANSFHGSKSGDHVGDTLIATTNGNVVVGSPDWDAPGQPDAGAVTWIDGVTGRTGTIDATNSLVGALSGDAVGSAPVDPITPLAGGGALVFSPSFHSNGAATFISKIGTVGVPSTTNSLLGTLAHPVVGSCGCFPPPDRPMSNGSVPISRANLVTLLLPDQTVPTFSGPPPSNITTSVPPATPTAIITFPTPTALDPDNAGPVGVVCDRASGSAFPIGVTAVHCTATNEVGLTATTTFTVTITVQPVPVIVGTPTNISVATPPGGSSAMVTYTAPTASDANGSVPVTCTPASGSAFAVGTTTVTCSATNSVPQTATTTFAVTVTATSLLADFVPLSPTRLADTRPAQTTTDGLYAGVGAVEGGTIFDLAVAGRGGAPSDATAAALNVTITEPGGPGFVTVYPCGTPRPTASNLNFETGQTIANLVVSKIGLGGKVCFFSSRTTHLVVDITGTVPPTSTYVPLDPSRVLDTRTTSGPVGTGSVTPVQIGGQATIPADAKAVVLNVTVTDPAAPGYATVYPCGADSPTASNVNFSVGQTIPNLVVAKLGAGGQVCIFSQQSTNLVVDVAGYFPANSPYTPLTPARLLETRTGLPTIDGESAGIGIRSPGTVTTLHVNGRGGVATGAVTVVLNVTVTGALGGGYVSVYPCGITPPNASNLNFTPGQTISNAVITRVGTGGNVCLLTSQPTDLVADVTGYMPS